jgi:putative CocE/NonD family hydrolase
VPTLGGSNLAIKCGPLDQRPNLNRSDVIYFRTPALTAPLPLTGPLQAVLYVSSNCTDTDFSVMIADVYPSGATRLLQDAVLRMRWRDLANTALPQPMQPGEVYEVLVDLWNTSYVLAPGHRLHVSISSSNYPRFSVNPNNGLPLSQNGTALIAENAVLMGPDYPSRLVLPVVTLDQMPAHKVLNDIASAQPADPRVAAAVAAAQGIIERHQQRWVHEHAKLGDSELP